MKRFASAALVLVPVFFVISLAVPLAYAADTKEPAKKTIQKKEAGFIASSQSKTYHVASCSYAKNIKAENLVKFSTKAEAAKAGYQPCKACVK